MSEQYRRRRHREVVWRQQQKHFGQTLPRHSCSGLQDTSLELSQTSLFRSSVGPTAGEHAQTTQSSPAALMRAVHEAAAAQLPAPATVLQTAAIAKIIHQAAQAQLLQSQIERAS